MFHHVASTMFFVVLAVMLVASAMLFDHFVHHFVAVIMGGFAVTMNGCVIVFHTIRPFVLPLEAMPSARREAELTEPPFFIKEV